MYTHTYNDRANVRTYANAHVHTHDTHVFAHALTQTRTLPCYGALRPVVRTDEGERVGETFEYKWPSFAVAHPNQLPSRRGRAVFK